MKVIVNSQQKIIDDSLCDFYEVTVVVEAI